MLYSDPVQRDRVGFAFLRDGLRAGNRCLCLVDQLEAARVLELTARQVNAEDARDGRSLDVHRASDVCLESGQFSVDRTISFLADCADRATVAGFPLLRVMVDMGWLLRQPHAVDDILAYESVVNAVAEQAPAVGMCAYDLHRLGVEMLVEVLRTHETVLLDGTVLVNPHHQIGAPDAAVTEPDQAQPRSAGAQGRGEQATARDPWHDLTDSELRIVAHVADGRTNREIAELLMVSRHTVDAHLKHIYIKLDIHTRVELTVLALHHPREGLTSCRLRRS